MSTAIARAQLAAVARHPEATTTERHFANEMLRGPVSVEVAALCRAAVERLLGVVELGQRPAAADRLVPGQVRPGRPR